MFGFATSNAYVGTFIALGYIAGESMGWGEWIGGIIRNDGTVQGRRRGDKNGIQWLATRFTELDSYNYHILALGIRGFYWWLPTLAPLMLFVAPSVVLTAVLLLSIGFPLSVVFAEGVGKLRWNRAETIYGGIQDVTLLLLILIII